MYWLASYIWNVGNYVDISGIAIGPVLGYVYQYKLIEKKQKIGTFSINLCGMLLFCNILRIGFYIFRNYAQALLVQSFIMIIVQLFLLKLCVEVMNKEGMFDGKNAEGLYDQQQIDIYSHFWRWPTIKRYFIVTFIFTACVFTITIFFYSLEVVIVGEIIGYLSLISESLLMLPQVIENLRQGRVKGLSHLLVWANFSGDLMKFAYFIVNDQPLQFYACGVIQCFIDAFVIFQIYYYKRSQDNPSQQNNNPANEDQKPSTDAKIDGEIKMIEQQPGKIESNYDQLEQES